MYLNLINRKNNFLKLQKLKDALFSIIYPPRCPVCGEIPEVWDFVPICRNCLNQIEKFPRKNICFCCGKPISAIHNHDNTQKNQEISTKKLCYECQENPKPYSALRSAFIYQKNSPIKHILLSYKYGRNLALVKPLVKILDELYDETLPDIEKEILIPIPLHWRRIMQRGFNQSALLASELSKLKKRTVLTNILVRVRNTPPQKGNFVQRTKNIINAFQVKHKKKIVNRNILLIDDVVTTSSTISECTRVLLSAGANKVRAITVARAVL